MLPIDQLQPGLYCAVHSEHGGLPLHVLNVPNIEGSLHQLLPDVKYYQVVFFFLKDFRPVT